MTSRLMIGALLAALAVLPTSGAEIRQPGKRTPKPASPPIRISQIPAPRIVQGPMLGYVSEGEARIWVRLNGPHRVRVRYSPSGFGDGWQEWKTKAAQALPTRDHTAIISLKV